MAGASHRLRILPHSTPVGGAESAGAGRPIDPLIRVRPTC